MLSPVKNIIIVAWAVPSRSPSKAEMKIMPFPLISFLTDLHWGNGLRPFEICEFYLPNYMSRWFKSSWKLSSCHQTVIRLKISVSMYLLGRARSLICLLLLSHQMDFLYFSDAISSSCTGPFQLKPFCWILFISNGLKRPSFSAGQPHSTFMSTSRQLCSDFFCFWPFGDCKTS